MRSFCNRLTVLAAFALIVGLTATAQADSTAYQWEYSVASGPSSGWMPVVGNLTSGTGTASVFGGALTITINTNSNAPGSGGVAELFNATTDVVNSTGAAQTVTVSVSEINFTQPIGVSNLTGTVSNVTVSQQSLTNPTLGSATYSATASVGTNTIGDTSLGTTNSFSGSLSGADGTGKSLPGAVLTAPPVTTTGAFSLLVSNTIAVGVNSDATLSIRADLVAAPEPSTMAIAGLGALGMIGYGLRRRKAQGA
jgi:hypothetical protein